MAAGTALEAVPPASEARPEGERRRRRRGRRGRGGSGLGADGRDNPSMTGGDDALETGTEGEFDGPESEDEGSEESAAAPAEDAVASLVSVALPEERRRIRELLDQFPEGMETKTGVLLEALRQLWRISSDEKVVIFTTYLGSIENLRAAIDTVFPGKRVEVLE